MTHKKPSPYWIGHILCRNCLLKHFIEGKIEEGIKVTGRRGRRHKKVQGDLKKKTGYCKLKEKAQIALCRELALEEAVGLSQDGPQGDDLHFRTYHSRSLKWIYQFQMSGCTWFSYESCIIYNLYVLSTSHVDIVMIYL